MEFEKSSLIKHKLLPHRRIRMCALSWMLIYRFLTHAIQVCASAFSFYGSAISAQSKPWVVSPCTATGCYQTVAVSQLSFGEVTCKPRLRHGHVEDIHTSVYGSESHICLRSCAYCNRLYILTRCCLVTRLRRTHYTLTRQRIPSKTWYQSTRLHCVITQKAVLFIFTDFKTPNVMFSLFLWPSNCTACTHSKCFYLQFSDIRL
jgi:hypothetical protein